MEKKIEKENIDIEKKINEFFELVLIINNVVRLDKETLYEAYKEHFQDFLIRVSYLIDYDYEILYLDETLIDKIKYVIDQERFKEENKKYCEVINEFIIFFNRIKTQDEEEKYDIVEDYYEKENRARRELFGSKTYLRHFQTIEDFLDSKAFDAVLIQCLADEDLNNLYYQDFLFSTCYFLNVIPEIYDKYNWKEQTKNKVNEIYNSLKKYKIFEKNFVSNMESTIKKL